MPHFGTKGTKMDKTRVQQMIDEVKAKEKEEDDAKPGLEPQHMEMLKEACLGIAKMEDLFIAISKIDPYPIDTIIKALRFYGDYTLQKSEWEMKQAQVAEVWKYVEDNRKL